MTKRQMEALDRREEQIAAKSNRTNYSQGIIGGHYAGCKAAAYIKTHTRCTKGHGWTVRSEFGGCAICEQEEE